MSKYVAVAIACNELEDYKAFNSKEEAIKYLEEIMRKSFSEEELKLFNISKEEVERLIDAAKRFLTRFNHAKLRGISYYILEV